jgi:protein-S-isoprenylcysteine O-methyltransferase Ste14
MTIADRHDVTRRNLFTRQPIRRALFNTLMSAAGFAICVVVPAARWTSPRPWVMLGVFLIVHVIGTIRIVRANPDLLPERAKLRDGPGQPFVDKLLLYTFMASYAAMLIVSSIDGSRWHVWATAPMAISFAGLSLFAAGWWLVLRALETNAFAVRVVRHQPERGHRVVDNGVYRVVRHPMYAGLVCVMIGAPLWLDSTLGLLLAAAPIGTLALRILVEERVLREHVPGYVQYAQRVRKRLIPGVW